jgi:FkbH-like protein
MSRRQRAIRSPSPGAAGFDASHSSTSAEANADLVNDWRRLLRHWSATHEYSRLVRLSREAERLAAQPEIASRLLPVRLALVADATTDFMVPVLRAALFNVGLRPWLYVAPYGPISLSLLDTDGALARFRPQLTIVFNVTQHLPPGPGLTDSLAEVERYVDEVCESLLTPCAVFHERSGSELLMNNFHALPWRAAGNLGAKLAGDPTNLIHRINVALGDRAPRYLQILDVASLAEERGLDTWFDERYWYLARQPISFACVSDYCRSVAATVGAIFGRSKKCLVLDLDNTLWGGVIGEDGLSGIHIGEGSAEGEAFKAFQLYVKQLKDRGVLLAVCSKNDERSARSAFTDHPEMVLRLDDFVAFKANWRSKPENLLAIASEVGLPLEAMVFVDDNPAERDEVAQALPDVTVPALPDDPAGFVRALDHERLFEAPALTNEDLARTATYHARSQTLSALSEATDRRSFLQSLQMKAVIHPFEPVSFERITQLVNKTNQFNLTTPRLVLATVQQLASDAASVTRTVRLQDRFGDHGLVSVLFGRIAERRLMLDAWLMSCRVLGRGVEFLLFNHLVAIARERGLQEMVGYYRPTDRNELVKDHYAKLGFSRASGAGDVEEWRLSIAQAATIETFIAIEDDAPHDQRSNSRAREPDSGRHSRS